MFKVERHKAQFNLSRDAPKVTWKCHLQYIVVDKTLTI